MILSSEQQTLVAQLVKKQDSPEECYMLIKANAKTRAFGNLFEKNGMLTIGDETVELTPKFFVQAHLNGITDEAGQITEEGDALAQEQIKESFQLFRALISVVS